MSKVNVRNGKNVEVAVVLCTDAGGQQSSAERSSLDGLSASTTEQNLPQSGGVAGASSLKLIPSPTGLLSLGTPEALSGIRMPNTSSSGHAPYNISSSLLWHTGESAWSSAATAAGPAAPRLPNLMSSTLRMRRTSPVAQPSTAGSVRFPSRRRGADTVTTGGAGIVGTGGGFCMAARVGAGALV